MNVNAHLQTFVVNDKGCQRLYSLSSVLISVQNHTAIVINKDDKFKTNKELSCLPIKRIKLIKKRIDIFQ